MKKISKMADFNFYSSEQLMYYYPSQNWTCVVFPLVLPHRIPSYFFDLSKQFKQNTCNIQFIESYC